jgi:hypothetical protein
MKNVEITFFEDLVVEGQVCPPADAAFPNGEKEYFRVLNSSSQIADNFDSHRKKFPNKVFGDECVARSLSLSDSVDGLINGFFKLPANKKKARKLGLIVLLPKDGLIKQTGNDFHYSWWRSNQFDFSNVTVKEIEV